ncbi:MAG: hypothetical protein KA230_09645 [Flavobacteriales bacterium]|nr:hypothetical protein [Flavobacteriales bacterium]
MQRWLTDLLNLFLVPEDRNALRPWPQLILFIVVVVIVLAVMGTSSRWR